MSKVRGAVGHAIPAVILTAEVGQHASDDAARLGGALVEKPVPVAVLIRHVEMAFNHSHTA